MGGEQLKVSSSLKPLFKGSEVATSQIDFGPLSAPLQSRARFMQFDVRRNPLLLSTLLPIALAAGVVCFSSVLQQTCDRASLTLIRALVEVFPFVFPIMWFLEGAAHNSNTITIALYLPTFAHKMFFEETTVQSG